VGVVRALWCLALAGCSVDIGPAAPWVPIDQIAGGLAPETGAAPVTAMVSPRSSLRVVQYNVDEERHDLEPAQLAAAIMDDPALARADVFMLQEEEAHPEEGSSRTSKLANLLGLGYVYVPGHPKGTGTHGLAILSAYPIADVEKMDLPLAGPDRRIAVSANIIVGDRSLHVVNVYLEACASGVKRIAQLSPAVDALTTPVLVTGDFNMTWVEFLSGPPEPCVPILSGSSASDQATVVDSYMGALGFDEPAAHVGPTAHAFGLDVRLDGIYPRGLTYSFGGLERVGPSDHWPLWIDVDLP